MTALPKPPASCLPRPRAARLLWVFADSSDLREEPQAFRELEAELRWGGWVGLRDMVQH